MLFYHAVVERRNDMGHLATIRDYESADCETIVQLFYKTVHVVNAADYSSEQLDAWAPAHVDAKTWDLSFRGHDSVVAERDGEIVGFADMAADGYLDRLYVSADHQHQGIATMLCDRLELGCNDARCFVTHASITAKGFFERRGYGVTACQQVIRHGIALTNYVMVKPNTH
ncbi:GNAT family N-acetyltransferase [Bifidobacterium oedipodis]|uniref:GNAT family acetyltransferase n=1 Tax=Bifidobacterium oedipodis TaxID=2675322 RepID=A0A7Y0ENN7_9BIFI|nr:GNAT family N-acetyltransferase [Bifidobacterium sp. DSM 109957]NMM93502.1 GNAT family acetyltransferase [Bifidobacterium sp. DSM 109957]